MRVLLAVTFGAMFLVSCGSVENLVGGDDAPKSMIEDAEAGADNSVRLTVSPGVQTTAWFLFSASAPEGGRIRVKFTDPTGWIPGLEEKVLTELETLPDGTFPKAASLPVDEDLTVRLLVDYQDPGGRWQRMSLLFPVSDAQWDALMPAGKTESDMIRWAVHGDPMNGSFGVKIRIDR
jgi:hypothetical protein